MSLSIVATVARNGVIDIWNRKPIPSERERFNRLTNGKLVVMGRKTYELLGRLPYSVNCILTTHTRGVPNLDKYNGIIQFTHVQRLLDFSENKDIMIVGGEATYEALFPYCDNLYITRIDSDIEGIRTFPLINDAWEREIEQIKLSTYNHDINSNIDEDGNIVIFENYKRISSESNSYIYI